MSLRPDSNREAITAGKRDRRITLERYGFTRNEFNEPIEGWEILANEWASKKDVSDAERLRSSEIGSIITTRFVIRWSKKLGDLNTKDRLQIDGLTYNIVGVKDLGRREGIEITASAASDLFQPNPEPGP